MGERVIIRAARMIQGGWVLCRGWSADKRIYAYILGTNITIEDLSSGHLTLGM